MIIRSSLVVTLLLCIAPSNSLLLSLSTTASTRLDALSRLREKAESNALSIADVEESIQVVPGRTEIEVVLAQLCDRDALREQWKDAIETKLRQKDIPLPEALGWKAWGSSIADDAAKVEENLERFRRVVALRQNRVLVPGRAAELYVSLISALINANEWMLAKRVLEYVGMASHVYLKEDEEKGASHGVIDLNALSFNVAKIMLDLPLLQHEWELDGKERNLPEPLTAKESGENVAEWLWKQVPPPGGWPELECRAADMTLSILRAAFRHAKDVHIKHISIRLQHSDLQRPYKGLAERGVLVPQSSVTLLATYDAEGLDIDIG